MIMIRRLTAAFSLGQARWTPEVRAAFQESYGEHWREEVSWFLLQHLSGNWGEVCAEDWQANDESVLNGTRILSAYTLTNDGEQIWIITEADRSATTIMLPSEY